MARTEQRAAGVRRTLEPPPTGAQARQRLFDGLPVTERRRRAAGVDTGVVEGGDGPPIVLLQGEFAIVWVPVLGELTTTNHVVIPDLPGLGASAAPAGKLEPGDLVAWLGDVVEATCQTTPVLVGKSAGGALAARFAVERPAEVERLVLVDSYGLEHYRPPLGMVLSFAGVLLRPDERRLERSFSSYCFVDLPAVAERMGEDWGLLTTYAVQAFGAPGTRTAMRRLMGPLSAAIPAEDLARIGVPTTLIWGRHDVGVPLEVAERASERYGWPLHVIEEARDDPAIEQPEAFLAALRSALDD